MIPHLWALLLLGTTASLVLLPLLPGCAELLQKRDVAPLRVIAEYDRDIRHFARGFRAYVQRQLDSLGPLPAVSGGEERRLPDGTAFGLVRRMEPSAETLRSWTERPLDRVLIVQTPLALPPALVATAEIYATEPITVRRDTTLRGLLGEADVELEEGCVVLRWLHGEADVRVGARTTLYGRASAEGMLRLAEGCQFQRIQAARIEFGGVAQSPHACAQPAPEHAIGSVPHTYLSPRCWLVRGDAVIASASRINLDLVARGEVVIGEGAHAHASLKAHGDLRLAGRSRVDGSVIGGRSVHVGEECRLRGPVTAEDEVYLARGTVVGSRDHPTTVSATRIRVEPGVIVFGAVWVREVGSVGPFA